MKKIKAVLGLLLSTVVLTSLSACSTVEESGEMIFEQEQKL